MASIWRCSYVSHHSSGVQFVNVFHVVNHDTSLIGHDATADDVRDALHTALTTKYRAILPTTVTVDTLVVREELAPGSTSVPSESSQTIGAAGTLTTSGDQLPVPVCNLVTLYSNAAVRSGHGRLFLPGCVGAGNLDTNGNWDMATAYQTAVTAFMDELKATHTHSGWTSDQLMHLVVYSRTRRAAALANYWFDVVSYTKRTQPHWLRSRLSAP